MKFAIAISAISLLASSCIAAESANSEAEVTAAAKLALNHQSAESKQPVQVIHVDRLTRFAQLQYNLRQRQLYQRNLVKQQSEAGQAEQDSAYSDE